jgi:hypothetical protein
MPSAIDPFSNSEALPTISITLSHAGFSVSTNALLDIGSTGPMYYLMMLDCN